jgi:hypothetical protein
MTLSFVLLTRVKFRLSRTDPEVHPERFERLVKLRVYLEKRDAREEKALRDYWAEVTRDNYEADRCDPDSPNYVPNPDASEGPTDEF